MRMKDLLLRQQHHQRIIVSRGVVEMPLRLLHKRPSQEEEEGPDFEDYWYDQHYNFFRRAQKAQDENFYYDEFFSEWHSARRQEYKRRRGEADYRDQQATTFLDDTCMFCGINMAITKEQAEAHGINWDEYNAHPNKYRTCWQCKDDHVSVMTKKMAIKKFAKKLDFKYTSHRTGFEYRPIFWFLKCDKKFFHHQPKTDLYNGPTLNSVYYWYPDLEEEALARGWKPRGAKTKEAVPWKRKDVRNDTAITIVTPERTQKKQKRS